MRLLQEKSLEEIHGLCYILLQEIIPKNLIKLIKKISKSSSTYCNLFFRNESSSSLHYVAHNITHAKNADHIFIKCFKNTPSKQTQEKN